MQTSLLQSKKWQKLQDDLGETTFTANEDDFSYLAILKNTPFGKYLYLPYGPVYDTEKGFKNALRDLSNLAERNQAFFIRIEPQDKENAKLLTKKASFAGLTIKKSKDLNPAETWVIDLSGSDDDLKKRLPSRLLRYWRAMDKNGFKIETSKNPEDVKYLLDLQKKLAKKKKISTVSESYYKTQLKQDFATLYLVKKDDKVVAAGLVFDFKNTRYNLQGAQDEEYRKFHATGILTIQLILDAKAKGLKIFDCWGIAPENAPKNHPWAGFTAFKKTFEGRKVDYCGDYDLILSKRKYRLYKGFRKVNRLIRKAK